MASDKSINWKISKKQLKIIQYTICEGEQEVSPKHRICKHYPTCKGCPFNDNDSEAFFEYIAMLRMAQ